MYFVARLDIDIRNNIYRNLVVSMNKLEFYEVSGSIEPSVGS